MPHRVFNVLQATGAVDTVRWAMTDAGVKSVLTGFGVILGAVLGEARTVLFAFLWISWGADLAGGTARAIHVRWTATGRLRGWFDVGKALSGILKMTVALSAWVVAVAAEASAAERIGWSGDVAWTLLAAAALIFAYSFVEQVHYFSPEIGTAFRRLLDRIPARGKELDR